MDVCRPAGHSVERAKLLLQASYLPAHFPLCLPACLPAPAPTYSHLHPLNRCGNVAAILELGDDLSRGFKVFEAAPQEARGLPAKKAAPDYFL